MRTTFSPVLEDGRFRGSDDYSSETGEQGGMFEVHSPKGTLLRIISSGQHEGWEHVSVSVQHRVPNWGEMCFVKDLFWEEEELVIQYHPPKSMYINCHPYCLHMWRPINATIPLPPSHLI
jgi:hypothetical protein